MASNPLYPGYVPTPKDAPINPLYPGYFPGQAAARLPRGPDIKPNEFNFDQITKIIDAVSADYMLAGPDLPRWVIDRAVDDFRQNLKVSIKPDNVNAEDLDDYDTGSLPGAFGLNVNLDPIDWISDPQKTAAKMINGWWKSGVNWKDIETRYRTEAWSQVFNATAPTDFTYGASEALGVSMLGANLGAAVGLNYNETSNPLRLKGRGELIVAASNARGGKDKVTYYVDAVRLDASGNVMDVGVSGASPSGTVDLGEKVATSLQEFEVMGGFGGLRQSKFDAYAHNVYEAVVTEMTNHASARTIVSAPTPTGAVNAATLTAAQARLNILGAMENTGKSISDYIDDGLQKKVLKGEQLSYKDVSRLNQNLRENLATIDTQLTVLSGSTNTLLNNEADYLRRNHLDSYKSQVESLLNQPAFTIAEQARAQISLIPPTATAAATAAAKAAIEAAAEIKIQTLNPISTLNAVTGNATGGLMSRPLIKGTPFSPTHYSMLLKESVQQISDPSTKRPLAVGHLVSQVEQLDPSAASKILRGTLNFTRNDMQTMGAMDILESFNDGKLMEKYLWPRIKAYWTASTPAAYADRFLNRHSYFGLNLKDIEDNEFEKSIWHGAADLRQQSFRFGRERVGVSASGLAPNSTYGNWFTVKGGGGIAGVNIQAKLYGGKHFDAVRGLKEMMGEGLGVPGGITQAQFKRLMEVKGLNDLLGAGGMLSNMKLPKGLSAGDQEKLLKFAENIKNFKEWVDKNEIRISIRGAAYKSEEYYAALINLLHKQQLDKDAADITRRYVGRLQKLYFKLNAAQTAVLKKYGKIIAPLAYARKIIVDAISTLITKGLQVIAGAASGGVLAPIIQAIEPVIRFVVNVVVGKAIEVTKVFYEAIVKGDIDAVFKYTDKSAEKYAKIMLIVAGFFVALVVGPGENFMGAVTTSFSPVDNTLSAGIVDLFNPSGGSGFGIVVPSLANKPSSVYGFQFLDMPDTEITTSLGTFKLTSWDPHFRNMIDEAIKELQLRTGGYLGRLSDPSVGGLVNIVWAEPGHGGFCGAAFGKDFLTGNDTIIMGHGDCYHSGTKQWYMNYLFAHESAHIYNYRYNGEESFDGIFFSNVTDGGENTLPTYSTECPVSNSVSEDFAETLGNWVQLNTASCGDPTLVPTGPGIAGNPCSTEFWKKYPKHCEYADKVLTRP